MLVICKVKDKLCLSTRIENSFNFVDIFQKTLFFTFALQNILNVFKSFSINHSERETKIV